MADTRAQLAVEDWIRDEWMMTEFGQPFFRKRVQLSPGGVFDFDAVTADGSIVCTISTSGARTRTGNEAVGKIHKIRSDIFFLLLASAQRRFVVLTEEDMYLRWQKEVECGRVPTSIEFFLTAIPAALQESLERARHIASHEGSPV